MFRMLGGGFYFFMETYRSSIFKRTWQTVPYWNYFVYYLVVNRDHTQENHTTRVYTYLIPCHERTR